MSLKDPVKQGDWVRVSLWPGVWQVSRILFGFREDRWSLDEPVKMSERTLLFGHRAVNDSWKRSFSHRCCAASLVQLLEPQEQAQLDTLFASDAKIRVAFEKYKRTNDSIDLVANLSFGALGEDVLRRFPAACHDMLASRIDDGITLDDVLQLVREHGLDKHLQKLPRQRTLQLVSINHEIRGAEFVYRSYKTLNF